MSQRRPATASDAPSVAALLEMFGDQLLVVDEVGRISFAHPEVAAPTLSGYVSANVEARLSRCIRALQPGKTERIEYAVDREGEEHHFEARIRKGPEPGQATILLRDVSDWVSESAGRLARRDLEARSEAQLEIAYAASHDLRSPLRHIRDLASWIDEDAGESLGESRESLTQLRANAARLDELLNALLDYARAGHEHAAVEEVDLGACVQGVFEMLPSEGFDIEIADDLPVLQTARNPLERVILNLISNALKHHDGDRGRIVVAGRPVGSRYELTISDDGPGIPKDRWADVFKMFRTVGRDKGSGMGLALVKKLVEYSGGTIAVGANEPRGTTFVVRWPMVWGASERAPDSSAMRVLVVDDSALARELTRRMLERRGFAVFEAQSVARARAILEKNSVDVVVTDLDMPGEDSATLASRLRGERRSLPVLVLTAEPEPRPEERARALGANGYLVKPVRASVLAEALRAATES
jgi:signal transduction histidine kinase